MLTLWEQTSSSELGNVDNDACVKQKRRFPRSTTLLRFEIIQFLCFAWKILLKEKASVAQERQLIKFATVRTSTTMPFAQLNFSSGTNRIIFSPKRHPNSGHHFYNFRKTSTGSRSSWSCLLSLIPSFLQNSFRNFKGVEGLKTIIRYWVGRLWSKDSFKW